MAENRRYPDGVVSLEEFRNRLTTPVDPDKPEDNGGYERADYLTWRGVNDMLTILNAGASPGNLVVGIRKVEKADVQVFSAKDNYNWGYLVDKSVHDVEALTLDLEVGDEEVEQRLKGPIERLYVASLIGRHAINRDERIQDEDRLPTLRIGDELVNLEPTRLRSVTEWRAAAGLGLLAVGVNRPKLRGEIRRHLGYTLNGRLQYARSLGRYSCILGKEIEDTEIGDWFVGLCKPLNKMELTTVLSNTHLHKPTPEPES